MYNLVQIFFEAAAKHAERIAIIHKKDSITYGELKDGVLLAAESFKSAGIRKGSKVLVFVPMSIELYKTVLSLFYLGAVVVFVDEWANRQRLKKALSVVEVDVLIAPKKYLWLAYLLSPFRSIKKKISPRRFFRSGRKSTNSLREELSSTEDSVAAPTLTHGDDTALITFTTGSTGLPKAANRTHAFLREQFLILDKEIGALPTDICLVTLPIVLLSILGTGASGIIAEYNMKKPENLEALAHLEMIQRRKVSMLIASPYYIGRIAELTDRPMDLRKVMTGGAPVFPNMATKVVQAFPKAEILVAYGSTEAEPISVINAKDVSINEHGLSVGKPHSVLQIKILKIYDGEVVLGEEGWEEWESDFGEIIVAGPHVLTSYYNSREAFRLNKIMDESIIWHRTGDSGRLVDGILYLSGRCNQIIKGPNGYESLFLREYQLSELDDVIIGTIMQGKVIVEVERKIANLRESKEQISKQLSNLGIPFEEIHILAAMPRDPRHHSKIDYARLARMI